MIRELRKYEIWCDMEGCRATIDVSGFARDDLIMPGWTLLQHPDFCTYSDYCPKCSDILIAVGKRLVTRPGD